MSLYVQSIISRSSVYLPWKDRFLFCKNPLLYYLDFGQVSQKLLANLRSVVPPRDLGSIVQGRGGGHGRGVHHS